MLSFEEPTNQTPAQIVWNNISEADKKFNLQYFIAASLSWFKLFPDKNYQDLELELRNRKLNTYLIANRFNNKSYKLCKPDKTPAEYLIIYSCRPPPYALEELLDYWPNYQDNFKNLINCGVMVATTESGLENPAIKKINNPELEIMNKITDNKILIKFNFF